MKHVRIHWPTLLLCIVPPAAAWGSAFSWIEASLMTLVFLALGGLLIWIERVQIESNRRLREAFAAYQAELDASALQHSREPPSDVVEALGVLGLLPPVTFETVVAAYKGKVTTCHPDRGGAHDQFVKINQAYELLKARCTK